MKVFEDDINKLNIGAGAGLGYDFTENLFLEARYIFQLNDYFKIDNAPKIKTNYLNLGLGYRF
ncbi:outer membrane beta-barrel protein [Leeuwenhoekiella sp. W20_SRS_FM14]|uniref:outer membrane beta-barrel protein n=1 Tax=Leeuwenhoekiella sp. W20_SRS_FM14 TaxID=3240270 RepID=UPI003F94E07C